MEERLGCYISKRSTFQIIWSLHTDTCLLNFAVKNHLNVQGKGKEKRQIRFKNVVFDDFV